MRVTSRGAKFEVLLYRKRHRLFKRCVVKSRYAAKQLRAEWEEKYDHTYTVEVHKIASPSPTPSSGAEV
jgi:hypothetical protein